MVARKKFGGNEKWINMTTKGKTCAGNKEKGQEKGTGMVARKEKRKRR